MPKYKAKPHKGLLKRVRLTKSGKIKHQRSGGRHLRSNKTGDHIRALRSPAYLCDGDVWRISGLLPGMLPHAGATPPVAAQTPEPKAASKPRSKKGT
jgi:large subunit ribosomal protein L35